MYTKQFMKWGLAACCLTGGATLSAQAQVDLVKNGRAKATIVVSEPTAVNLQAARMLQRFVKESTGAELPLQQQGKAQKGDVIIGGPAAPGITEDGFALTTTNGTLQINGRNNGVIYGVVSLLENYLGMDYWAENEYSVQPTANVTIPLTEVVNNPAFRYRQTQCYAMRTDSIYKLWHRIEVPTEAFAAGYWVHTFDKLLPSAVYGKEHPEYYSYFKGKRHPGKASQWCLTNPEVFEIVAQRIDSIFKANPDQKLICVSQNDGNYTNCTCPDCKKLDDAEGGPSGSLIHFINKLADCFPDKEIATLAYLYTMNPPKQVKPRPNVVVMLCDIDCNREVSLTENASGREFMKALEGWSAISNNLFVWDYGINFDGMMSPFPNFHILQDNIRTFRNHHVKMHFSQIGGSYGGDFPELRAYLVAKLMWNPDADVEQLMHHFLNGYYGAAGPCIYRYIKMMEGALLGSGNRLWIYDSPVSHKKGMLKPELMRRYAALFDQAEQAVADNPTLLNRVKRTRLPLLYSELEILRTEAEKDYAQVTAKLDYFEAEARRYGNPVLNERQNYALDYCKLYRERYLPANQRTNLAQGAAVKFLKAPSKAYATLGNTALTDGLYGGASFVESWVGWEGTDGAFVLDLGEVKEVRKVSADFLHQIGQWILFPLQVNYSYSTDGEHFTPWKEIKMPEERAIQVLFRAVTAESETPLRARYIKVEVTGTKVCPHWHYGVGHPSWFFMDEVTVE